MVLKPDVLEECLDAAMQYYPRGVTYRVAHGQSWDDAAYTARRREIEPLVKAVISKIARAVVAEVQHGA